MRPSYVTCSYTRAGVPLTDPEIDTDPAARSYLRTPVIPVLSPAVIGVACGASSYAVLV